MSVDYDELKALVKEAMFTGGGINEPSGPKDVPHRMPASDNWDKEQDQGDPEANEMYDKALVAREATEQLVAALDEPIFDAAYEHAFKASACLRRALNSLESTGAHPMPWQQVVAPPRDEQPYGSGGEGDYAGGGMLGPALEEQDATNLKGFGTGTVTQSSQAKATREKGQAIGSGEVLQGVDNRERKILLQIEELLTQVADQVDLVKYRPLLQSFLTQFLKRVQKDPENTAQGAEE